MREKYIDEAAGFWTIFGKHPSGNVDVSDQVKDIFLDIPLDLAEQIVAEQHKFLGKLYKLLENE